jgi:HlyD family secretion protein/adhesin transport system membrane fusion protein
MNAPLNWPVDWRRAAGELAALGRRARTLPQFVWNAIWHTSSKDEAERERRIRLLKPYLAQSIVLEESGPPQLVQGIIIAGFVSVVGFISWSAIASFDETAVSSGEIVTAKQAKPVQHLEGGIVRQVRVIEGDLVEPGQILIELVSGKAQPALDQARANYVGLAAQTERLRAFTLERKAQFETVPVEFSGLVQDQIDILAVQTSARDQQRAVLKSQINGITQRLEDAKIQILSARRSVAILSEEFKVQEGLWAKGLSSKVTYLEAEHRLNAAQGELSKAIAAQSGTTASINETQSRLEDLDAKLRNEALAQMGTLSVELARAREELVVREDQVSRLMIRAPTHGYVKGLAVHGAGAVVEPGQVLLDIVPVDEELLAEVRISPRDIGHLGVGKPANVKILTYDYSRFGTIKGTVSQLSASSFRTDKDEPYFKGMIALDHNFVGTDPLSNRITPGMTVTADIVTGKKTLLQYLVKPISNALETSFHER